MVIEWKYILLIECSDKTIKLIELNNELIIKNLASHNNKVNNSEKNNSSEIWRILNFSKYGGKWNKIMSK